MRTSFTIIGDPVPKPRMTRADKWQQRDCVLRYRSWCDLVRKAATGDSTKKLSADVLGLIAFFHLPVPAKLGAQKKAERYGRMHREKPDTDNLLKGLADALFEEDKAVAWMQGHKCWLEEGEEPRTDVFLMVP